MFIVRSDRLEEIIGEAEYTLLVSPMVSSDMSGVADSWKFAACLDCELDLTSAETGEYKSAAGIVDEISLLFPRPWVASICGASAPTLEYAKLAISCWFEYKFCPIYTVPVSIFVGQLLVVYLRCWQIFLTIYLAGFYCCNTIQDNSLFPSKELEYSIAAVF